MRVCVVGCGAVGSIFAANLAQLDDVEVWAYDLAQEHVDAINAEGLRLSGAGEVVGRLRATSAAGELPACDFGIVATKAMHTEPAIAATAHVFAGGAVCSVQNGIGNEETLAGFAGALLVHQLGSITTEQVYLELTFLTLAMLVVGGITSLWGAVVGALAISGLDSFLTQAEQGVHVLGFKLDLPSGSRLVCLAAIMALVLILRPSGLTGGRELRLPRRRRRTAEAGA